MTPSLPVVIVVESECVPAWQMQVITALCAVVQPVSLQVVTLALPERDCVSRSVAYAVNSLLRLDAFLFRCSVSALESVALDAAVCHVSAMSLSDWLKTNSKVALVVNLTAETLAEDTLYAQHGVIYPYAYSPDQRLGAVAGVRAVLNCALTVNVGIARASGQHLTQATLAVLPSLSRTAESVYWFLAQHVVQTVQQLLAEHIVAKSLPLTPSPSLTWKSMALWSGQYVQHLVKAVLNRVMRAEQWGLLVTSSTDAMALDTLPRFTPLMPPVGVWWADPFCWYDNGKHYLVFEEVPINSHKGHIAWATYTDNHLSEPQRLLERPYHLSYPFLFEYGGQTYLIPESAENHTIELYRCDAFPLGACTKVMNLMEGLQAYDTTLFEHDGYWWLFATMRAHAACSPNDSLYVFYASTPLTQEWYAHPLNPVQTSVETARPAGRIFKQNNLLYRPSQVCSGRYGRGLNLQQIIQLSPTVYQECTVSRYIPAVSQPMLGVHTWNSCEGLTVADAFYHGYRGSYMARLIARLKEQL